MSAPLQDRALKTRKQLLEATIAVLVERGYAGAGLPGICRAAGVSRGAQQHHFPTKIELLCSAVDHLFERRLDEMASTLLGAELPSVDDFVSRLWRIYTGDAFYAFNELATAARTDAVLRARLVEVNANFYAAVHATLLSIFPNGDDARLLGAARYLTSLMNGLALNRILDDDDGASNAALELLKESVHAFLRENP